MWVVLGVIWHMCIGLTGKCMKTWKKLQATTCHSLVLFIQQWHHPLYSHANHPTPPHPFPIYIIPQNDTIRKKSNAILKNNITEKRKWNRTELWSRLFAPLFPTIHPYLNLKSLKFSLSFPTSISRTTQFYDVGLDSSIHSHLQTTRKSRIWKSRRCKPSLWTTLSVGSTSLFSPA